ncbi:hypothetical protein HZH68_003105 [Vespula germanica]|uniref:RING-type domain-containing protein n=2 Tax=Vespula TaxID=7451 RepID=A0A834NNP2_VESGE|nr:hypothetical protein HZH68_003105 [Vespula germanica]KAF7435246.1 hypothetical protein H0235_003437 [Vespula pensylvanica]
MYGGRKLSKSLDLVIHLPTRQPWSCHNRQISKNVNFRQLNHIKMACEACKTKFNLFKRRKQCTGCLRYFCSECLIKRIDKTFNCENCGMLARRPLIRSQIMQMRSRDLRQYLIAKKVSIKGCVEKEDLVNLLLIYANGSADNLIDEKKPTIRPSTLTEELPQTSSTSSTLPETPIQLENHTNAMNEERNIEFESEYVTVNNIEIEEISAGDCSPDSGPEPLVTEQDEDSETLDIKQSAMLTEIPVWSGLVKLSDINELSQLEHLSVKQLKTLLITNRVDFKGCVERCELLDRASRLWEEHNQARADIDNMDKEDICKICWDAPIECVILECGHMACCINCGKRMSECPICKQYVVRVVRFFKA